MTKEFILLKWIIRAAQHPGLRAHSYPTLVERRHLWNKR